VRILQLILTCYEAKSKHFGDYILITKIYVLLDLSDDAIKLLITLVQTQEKRKILLAYQLACDIQENEE